MRVQPRWLMAAVLFLIRSSPVRAQTSLTAFLPTVSRRQGLQLLGPSLQFNIRPLEALKKVTVFDLDDMKRMPVVFTIGYRYLPSSTQSPINRMQPIVMFHVPFPGTVLVTDRNRADLDRSSKSFDWTYRNRITAERRLTIRSYHPGSHVAADFAYQSQISKWSTTRRIAGCLLPLTSHIQIDAYYQHVNNTGRHPNLQVNAAGLTSVFTSHLREAETVSRGTKAEHQTALPLRALPWR